MTWRRIACIALVFALALPVCRAEDEAQVKILLAGDAGGAWLAVQSAEGKPWSIVVRTAKEAKWAKPWPISKGAIALGASGDSAAIFYEGAMPWRCYPTRQKAEAREKPSAELFPADSSILAICPDDGADDAMIVLVRRRPVARRSATTTTAPAPIKVTGRLWELALLRYAGGQWEQLAVLPAEAGAPEAALLASSGGRILVLPVSKGLSLHALTGGKWERIAPPDMAQARPLALTALAEGPVLTAFDSGSGEAKLFLLTAKGWSKPVTVKLGDKAAVWPEADGEPPQVSRLGAKLVLVWSEKDKLFFGQCGLDGSLTREEMGSFDGSTPSASVEQMRTVFFWLTMGVLLILMFWPGQAMRPAPFALPDRLVAASLVKRIVAFVIDYMPFSTVAVAVSFDHNQSFSTFRELTDAVATDTSLHYAALISLIAYVAYCIVMEHRFGGTLGKLLLKLRVIGDSGRRATLREIALRNVAKIPEFFTVILLIFPVLTRYRQRIGDKMAWTAVIDLTRCRAEPAADPAAETDAGQDADQQDEHEEKL